MCLIHQTQFPAFILLSHRDSTERGQTRTPSCVTYGEPYRVPSDYFVMCPVNFEYQAVYLPFNISTFPTNGEGTL